MALRASSVIFCGKIIFFAIKFDFFDVFRGLNNLFVFWQKKLTGVSQQQITCTAEKNGAHFVKHLFFCIIFGLLAEKHGLLAKNWQGFQNFFYVSRGTALGRFFGKKTIFAFCTSFLVSEQNYPYFRRKNLAGLPKLHYTSREEQFLDNLWKEEHLLQFFLVFEQNKSDFRRKTFTRFVKTAAYVSRRTFEGFFL